MKTIVKVTQMGLLKLNNAEYTNFSDRTLYLITAATPEALHLEMADVNRYAELLDQMQELVAMSRISGETAELAALDKERDDLGVYILTTVRHGRGVAHMATSATRLYNLLKPYTGFQRLPNQQETVTVSGMVTDLRKDEYAADVEVMGLTVLVEKLDEVNLKYKMLTVQRTEARASSKVENSKTVRAEMDKYYDYFMTVIQSHDVVNPTTATTTFISKMNALIEEINALYNQRTGNSGGIMSSTSGGSTGGVTDSGSTDSGSSDSGESDTSGEGGGSGGDDSGTNDDGGADFN